jgi:nucleoside-diphosphate-sugar epimerase
MKCFVTGASGFIGRELCLYLNARGVPFIGTSRSPEELPGGQTSVATDLNVQSVDRTLLDRIDVVFHLAGIAHQHAEPAAYERVNYRATLDLAASAAAAGVKLFVFLSSVKAMGASATDQPRVESECSTPVDAYGRSKRQAELALQETYADSEMSIVVLRPALVYGVGAKGNLALMARAVKSGVPRPPDIGGRSMVAREDLVELLYTLAVLELRGFHLWIICDGEVYSASRIHDLMRAALGKSPARNWLPAPIWRLGCGLRDLAQRATPGTTYAQVFGTECYNNAALVRDLGWQPRLGLVDSVAAILASGSSRPDETP